MGQPMSFTGSMHGRSGGIFLISSRFPGGIKTFLQMKVEPDHEELSKVSSNGVSGRSQMCFSVAMNGHGMGTGHWSLHHLAKNIMCLRGKFLTQMRYMDILENKALDLIERNVAKPMRGIPTKRRIPRAETSQQLSRGRGWWGWVRVEQDSCWSFRWWTILTYSWRISRLHDTLQPRQC